MSLVIFVGVTILVLLCVWSFTGFYVPKKKEQFDFDSRWEFCEEIALMTRRQRIVKYEM